MSVWELVVIVQFKLPKILLSLSELLDFVNDFGVVFHLLHVEVEVKLRVIYIDFQVELDLLVAHKWVRVF